MPSQDLKDLSILVVDDQASVRSIIARLLARLGAGRVETASSGAEAIARIIEAAGEPYNVVICDLSMPGGDGLVFLRSLAKVARKPAVILMSGKDRLLLESARRLGESLEVTILGTITKPLTGVALMQLLDTLGLREAMVRPDPPTVLTEREIANGLDEGRFELWFQPQYHVQSRRVVGVEALIRLRDDVHGVLGPASFIETAEQCGLIARLTDFVIEQAVSWSQHWRAAGWPLKVSVNLSKAGLTDLTLPDRAAALCWGRLVAPNQLTFELTESSLPTDGPALLDIMARLRLKGFCLSLDDFGTGYASLEQLQSLPFHELKLDARFVQSAVHNRRSRAILESAIDLAAALQMSTVAEGVETVAMLQLVVGLGCHVVQGYLVGRPMPANQILESLMKATNGPDSLEGLPWGAGAVNRILEPSAQTFGANVSDFAHDAAGPLMLMLMLSKMLLDDEGVSPAHRQDIAQIHAAAEELTAMINGLRAQTETSGARDTIRLGPPTSFVS